MAKKSIYVALVVCILCAASYLIAGQTRGPVKKAWEYRVVAYPSEQILNKLGAEGWELVSIAAFGDINNNYREAYLKRSN